MITTCGECPFFNRGKDGIRNELEPGQHMAPCSAAPYGERVYRRDDQPVCANMSKSTLSREWWGLLEAPTITLPHCAVCGRVYHLNQHHPIRRSAGNLIGWDGRKAHKPTITLCGNGNTEGCHGLAHQNRLFFEWDGKGWLYLLTKEPVSHSAALSMQGWRPIRIWMK